MRDQQLSFGKTALPAPGATVYTNAIDLQRDARFSDVARVVKLRVIVPALPLNASASYNYLFKIQDTAVASSYVGASYADANPQATYTLAGVASTGSAAVSVAIPLPPSQVANASRGAVRIACVSSSASQGDSSALQFEVVAEFS